MAVKEGFMHILFTENTVSVINLVLITPVPLSSMLGLLGLALLVTWLFPFSVCGT